MINSNRKRNIGFTKWILPCIAALSISPLLGCEEEVPPAPPTVRPVKILEVAGGGAVGTRDFPGEIRAAQQAELAFEGAGKLIELPVLDGQNVEKGQVLARLDPRDFESNRDAQNAKLAEAEADFSRITALFDADVTSQQEYDAAQSRYQVAKADADRAIKNLEEDSVVSAPFAGTVAKIHVENFQNVQAKQPIMLLQDTSTLDVAVAIPETGFAGNPRGGTAEERNAALNPVVFVSSVEGRSFPARVKEFSPTADPTSRTYEAVVSFETPDDVTILPGMTASVQVNVLPGASAAANTIQIPSNAAVADEQGKAYVWKIDPSSMQVSRSSVELGGLTGESVAVASGLSTGDWIAVSGVHQLREGMRIRRHEN
ncbi:MAG: RND family efflux transporter MFP subunit [Myxococcota bacterium]